MLVSSIAARELPARNDGTADERGRVPRRLGRVRAGSGLCGAWSLGDRGRNRHLALLAVAGDDDPLDALSEEDRRRFSEAISRAIRGGEYRLEFRARERWLSATGRVVRHGRGPASIVGTLQDITAHKVALEERELRLGEVAHGLLNPLTAIRLGIHVVRQG